jgi:hypothetical protein
VRREVWLRDSEGRPTRLVTVETYEDAVKAPQAWVWVAVAVFCIALAFLDGGVRW